MFNLTAITEGYIAVGISTSGKMVGDHALSPEVFMCGNPRLMRLQSPSRSIKAECLLFTVKIHHILCGAVPPL